MRGGGDDARRSAAGFRWFADGLGLGGRCLCFLTVVFSEDTQIALLAIAA